MGIPVDIGTLFASSAEKIVGLDIREWFMMASEKINILSNPNINR
jgi:hypothetical protein